MPWGNPTVKTEACAADAAPSEPSDATSASAGAIRDLRVMAMGTVSPRSRRDEIPETVPGGVRRRADPAPTHTFQDVIGL